MSLCFYQTTHNCVARTTLLQLTHCMTRALLSHNNNNICVCVFACVIAICPIWTNNWCISDLPRPKYAYIQPHTLLTYARRLEYTGGCYLLFRLDFYFRSVSLSHSVLCSFLLSVCGNYVSARACSLSASLSNSAISEMLFLIACARACCVLVVAVVVFWLQLIFTRVWRPQKVPLPPPPSPLLSTSSHLHRVWLPTTTSTSSALLICKFTCFVIIVTRASSSLLCGLVAVCVQRR